MPGHKQPPRPLNVGDVVAAHSPHLGEWTAAQIIHLDADTESAAVLELDWSGPEPSSVSDLGDVTPLRRTHHSWGGDLSFCNHDWLLPRSHKVIGTLPPLHDEPPNSWARTWRLGYHLALQQRWNAGIHDDPAPEWQAEHTALPGEAMPEITELTIRDIDTLDCALLVRRFPNLTWLRLYGRLGLLTHAGELNTLASLRGIDIADLFGMTEEDRLRPERVPELEHVHLYGVQADYALAMQRTWQPEIPAGTYVSISRPRTREWAEENRNNPLRDWDGREGINGATYTIAFAQYTTTRETVLRVLAKEPPEARPALLEQIGADYGEVFNQLDEGAEFIETVEREELYAALDHIMDEAEAIHGPGLDEARESLIDGLDSARDW
ncbi:tudor domain-containing protein [Herbidospora sp. RD11066]